VPEATVPVIAGWESFYVIIGSSAAALTGLMFVVITLGAEKRRLTNEAGLRAFASPTIVHFCAVVLIAALLTMPRHTIESLRLCLFAVAAGGLACVVWAVMQTRKVTTYQPVLSDWIWHTVLPSTAYTGILVAAILLPRAAEGALDVVGGAALGLLFIGIRNAWDAAVWIALASSESERGADPGKEGE
jgi:hypothetical protein